MVCWHKKDRVDVVKVDVHSASDSRIPEHDCIASKVLLLAAACPEDFRTVRGVHLLPLAQVECGPVMARLARCVY